MTASRLPAPWGLRLDRTSRVTFHFNGKRLIGFAGDTLASALLANGVRVVARSFKLHRPRGIFSCGIEEPCSLVDLGEGPLRTPNQRATLVELAEGLKAVSVNCWPSADFDVGALAGYASALLPAGFYYKTFMWPAWGVFERAIRRMAGFGRVAAEPDVDRYEEIAAVVDVAVVGGGIAGLAAAVAAAQGGASALLVAAGPTLGGALGWREDAQVAGLIVQAKAAGVRILTRTLAFGIYDHGLICARETLSEITGSQSANGAASGAGKLRERLWKIRARHIVNAAGAFERPMLFPDNDRPGVMLAGAADKYAHGFGVACGERVLVAANSDSAYAVAASLRSAGVNVLALLDRRSTSEIGPRAHDLQSQGVQVLTDSAILKVRGASAVRGCSVLASDSNGANARRRAFDCDCILSAGGFAPAVHLHSQAGGKLRWLDESAMFVPDGNPAGMTSVGACAGVFNRTEAVEHADRVGRELAHGSTPIAAKPGGAGRTLPGSNLAGLPGKQFVDLQNDVTMADVGLAARENYRSVEHLKRYTTTGMGTDQGKTSNINALVLMGEFTGRGPADVGTTKFRPPFAPVTLGLLAGRRVSSLYRPTRYLPAKQWHARQGALFELFGTWSRPAAYPKAGENLEEAAQREASAVRNAVGILDASPLGKLEVSGPDAAKFLDLMYVGTMSTLAIGQARYGMVLNENGVVMDDGIVARLDDCRYWVNTTSAGAERTAAAFEEWLQCEYGNLRVFVTVVTSRWGNVTVAGPWAWELLSAAGFSTKFAPQVMKHMTLSTGTLDAIPLRVLRASFSGELSYEINVPSSDVESLLQRLWSHGIALDAVLYGIEALEILRTEKGFVHIGTDTDGTTAPADIGFARALDRKAANFVGRRSLLRPAAVDAGRLQLVALSPADRSTPLPVGAQLSIGTRPTRSEGYVTSSHMSPSLGVPVALGMLRGGSQRLGERLQAHHFGIVRDAVVVTAPFLDPAGERLQGGKPFHTRAPGDGVTGAHQSTNVQADAADSGAEAGDRFEVPGLSIRPLNALTAGTIRFFAIDGDFLRGVASRLGGSLPRARQAIYGVCDDNGDEVVLANRSPTEMVFMCTTASPLAAVQDFAVGRNDGYVMDQTGASTFWEISGSRAPDFLARLGSACVPEPGECRVSRVADVSVMTLCIDAGRIWLSVDRQFAEHLSGWFRVTAGDL